MLKYLAILSLSLCACGGAVAAPVPVLPAQSPVVAESDPVDIELARGLHAQAVRCTSELNCFQKLSGLCPNGYVGGQTLSDGTRVVGTLFKCISDEEKAAEAQRQAQDRAQEAAWKAAQEERLKAMQEAQLKAQQEAAQKKSTKK